MIEIVIWVWMGGAIGTATAVGIFVPGCDGLRMLAGSFGWPLVAAFALGEVLSDWRAS